MKSINRRKKLYIFSGALAGSICLLMVVFPAISLEAAKKGVSLWASSVLPAMLPFFICANFMTALGIPRVLGRVFERPVRFLFGAPGSSAFVLTVSVTSGYPMGAKLIGDLVREKEVTLEEAKRMLSFCSTSGPLFMLGAVGVGMLGSSTAGGIITVSHYVGALLTGLAMRLFTWNYTGGTKYQWKYDDGMTVKKGKTRQNRAGIKTDESLLDLFTRSILSSLKSLGVICCYIVLFTMVTDFIQFSGLLSYIGADWGKGFVKGLLEMTVGCSSIGMGASASLAVKTVLCTFLISFGGISVMAQSASMLSGVDIGMGYYLKIKLLHGIFAALTAIAALRFVISEKALETGAFSSGGESASAVLGTAYQWVFSVKMMGLVLFIFIVTILLNNWYNGIVRFLGKIGKRRVNRKLAREQKRRQAKEQKREKRIRGKEQKD